MEPKLHLFNLYVIKDINDFPGLELKEYDSVTQCIIAVTPEWNGCYLPCSTVSDIIEKFNPDIIDPAIGLLRGIEFQCEVNVLFYCHYDKFGKALTDSSVWPAYIVFFVVPKFIAGFRTYPADFRIYETKGSPFDFITKP